MIKTLFLDVDGTLTDGQIYISNDGEAMKSFHAHDAVGLRKLPQEGINTIIITGRESNIVNIRAKEMNITEVYQNVSDKKEKVLEIMKKNNLKKEEVAYIGDDENDYEAMLCCENRACPKNATFKIKDISNYVSNYDGGYGAVREYCEFLLNYNESKKGSKNN